MTSFDIQKTSRNINTQPYYNHVHKITQLYVRTNASTHANNLIHTQAQKRKLTETQTHSHAELIVEIIEII